MDRNDIVIRRPFNESVQLELMAARLEAMLGELGLRPMGGGAAGAWVFTNGGRTSLIDGLFDIDTDTWKMALFLSTSNIGAASTTYAGLTNEHANANGYLLAATLPSSLCQAQRR
ncbi:hypothetical protein LCGC14_1191920 [marine sediment metagenome]|uniref:Uncharacterized protein n=1 Tax=marine sediment metagenome TaxID=412755 RepID=A0A0F9P1R9_9ZZZZ